MALALAPVSALSVGPWGASPDPVRAVAASHSLIEVPHRAPVHASRAARAEPFFVGRDGEVVTAARIRSYLTVKGSPLRRHAEQIVRAGVSWRVDPRYIVAIAGVESDFGRAASRFNAWGWGVRDVRYFSWPNAIERFAKALATTYPSIRRGDLVGTARRYNPVNPPAWARKVSAYFLAI